MPFVQVYAYAGRTEDQKRRLVRGITDAVCDAYEVPPETVAVYLFDMPKGDTAHGGVLGSDVADPE